MKVFLVRSVPKIGLEGEIIEVSEGYARNFLIPKKLGIEVTPHNQASFANRLKTIENRKQAIATQESLLAEKIKLIEITLAKKMHDKDRLYGAVTASEIVDLLKKQGLSIDKNQVNFNTSIKSTGTYSVTIALSAKLAPALTLHVIPEN